MFIRYNTLNVSEGETAVIKKGIVHPKYKLNISLDYDIAIIQLEKPLNLKQKNAKALCLLQPNDDPAANTIVTVSGWGLLGGNYTVEFEQLMAVDVPVVGSQHCEQQFEKYYKNVLNKTFPIAALHITDNM